MKPFVVSVDVEPDLHSPTYESVDKGLIAFEQLCDRYNIKPVLFVTADCIRHNPKLFRRLHKKGWEISLHGFTHRRFDHMTRAEKEDELKQSIAYWVKYLQFRPKGFRAPQHSIDDETLDLLEKYKFEYDSSYTPLNFMQLVFFPRAWKTWAKHVLSPRNPYHIRKNLLEKPSSALIVPFVSLTVRFLPVPLLRHYIWKLTWFYQTPHFYAHSWDFIALPKSRIDRLVPHGVFLKKLESLFRAIKH